MFSGRSISLTHYARAGEVAEFIRGNVTQRQLLSLEALSKRFGLSQTYLTGSFKYRYKTTVNHFIIECRIGQATKMLCAERMSVKEITYSLGYKEINHLTRDFKKIMGMPPTQYKIAHCMRQTTQNDTDVLDLIAY